MYQAFEEAKLQCKNCTIGNAYNCVVPSDGCKSNPTVLIVGEAPGKDEVYFRKPFVGEAGKLLRSTLNQFGYNKNNSLITNTIPCRPQNNKFPIDVELVNNCVRSWLKREIEITKPQYMLLVGATPTKYLLGLTGITRLRGDWYNFPDADHPINAISGDEVDTTMNCILCMPTYHSSYVLRKQYMDIGKEIKECFINDIKSVAEKAGFLKPKVYNN